MADCATQIGHSVETADRARFRVKKPGMSLVFLESNSYVSVDKKLLELAGEESILLHCLPAHRGEEITEEALESQNSYVFEQAENRLHIQQALLAVQLGGL